MQQLKKQALRYGGAFVLVNVVLAGVIGGLMGFYGYGPVAIGNAVVVPVLVVKFVLYKYWVFENDAPKWILHPSAYLLVVGGMYSMYLGLYFFLANIIELNEWAAAGVAGIPIGFARFFLFRRFFKK